MNIIIPICGKGLRFRENGYYVPKHMIQILDKEMICYVLDIIKNSITDNDNVYIIHYHEYDFTEILKKYSFLKLISINNYTKGAVETIQYGLKQIITEKINENRKCLLLDCDTFYTTDIITTAKSCSTNAVFYFEQCPHDNSAIFSYIIFNETNNIITDIVEKKRISNYANTGAYLFVNSTELLEYCNKVIDNNITFQNEYYTSCVIHCMVKDEHIFEGIKLKRDDVIFLGTPKQVKEYIDHSHAFLFDLDGTLVSTDNIYKEVWNEILHECHIHMTDEIYTKYIHGNSDNVSLMNIFSNNTPYDIDEISLKKDTLFLKHLDKLTLIPNSINFIKNVKKHGHKICIVTNCNRLVAEEILKYIKIDIFIDYLIIGNECKKPKPFPDPYIRALELLNIPSSKTIIFEDSSSGLLSAKSVFPKCIVGIYQNDSSILDKYKTEFKICDYSYSHINIDQLIGYEKNLISDIRILLQNNTRLLPNIVDFKIHSNKLKGGFIADVLHIDLINNKDEIIPCILKLKNEDDTNMTRIANQLDLYEREFYFYQNINPYINIKTPYCYGIVKSDDLASKGILLENLNSPEYVLNLNLNQEHIDVSLKVIKRLAELHSKFTNTNKNLLEIFPLLKKHNDKTFNPYWGDYVADKWNEFKSKWSSILTSSQLEKAELIMNKFSKIQDYLSKGMLTLCHGDVKSANIFYKKETEGSYEPYFIDWQYIAYGKGAQDLVFFMIESYEINKIHDYIEIFKLYYYHNLLFSNKDIQYSYSDYENDFTVASCYFPFFVAIWFGTTNKNDLIDVNFPFFFIQKYFNFLENYVNCSFIEKL